MTQAAAPSVPVEFVETRVPLPPPRRRAAALARRWLVLAVGVWLLVLGVAATIAADVGAGSWQVLEVALAEITGLGLGTIIVAESLVAVSLAWGWLKQAPGPATVLLALGGGPLLEWILGWLHTPASTGGAIAMMLAGSLTIAVGIGLYVPAELGPSAQDSLFVGLYRHFDIRAGVAKFGSDFLIVAVGWALGGPVGIGTVIITFLVPPVIEVLLPLGHRLAGTRPPATPEVPVTATSI